MKAIILAGGFGTRLLPLTRYIPKALLPVAGKPIIDFQLEQILSVNEVDRIVISTNAFFKNNFFYWWNRLPPNLQNITKLVIEPSQREGEKFGSIRGLQYVIENELLLNDELIVMAGDNLFGFSLPDVVNFYHQNDFTTVALCQMDSEDKVRGKYGVGILDKEYKIIQFEEKPLIPKSTLASTGCYIFTTSIINDLHEYITQNANVDALGNFIGWLCRRTKVFGYTFQGGWYDIGSLDSYSEANIYYSETNSVQVGVN